MKITPKNIIRHEIIGLKVSVIKSTNKCNIGISGIVVNETMKTIVIATDLKKKKYKRIPKEASVFVLTLPDNQKIKVDGKVLLGRPEDRLTKRIKWW